MAPRLMGQSQWTRANGATHTGDAVAVWHRPGHGRQTIDLTEGQYDSGAVIEGTSDDGTWSCPAEGDAGTVFAKLCLMRHGTLLNGKRGPDAVPFEWTLTSGDLLAHLRGRLPKAAPQVVGLMRSLPPP